MQIEVPGYRAASRVSKQLTHHNLNFLKATAQGLPATSMSVLETPHQRPAELETHLRNAEVYEYPADDAAAGIYEAYHRAQVRLQIDSLRLVLPKPAVGLTHLT